MSTRRFTTAIGGLHTSRLRPKCPANTPQTPVAPIKDHIHPTIAVDVSNFGVQASLQSRNR